MAKDVLSMYFAVKLVATSVGDKSMRLQSVPDTNSMTTTKDWTEEENSAGDSFVTIGGKKPAPFHGIAGHFKLFVLDFTDAEDASCKTAAEAERLVATKHKEWLANAYDWYVIPASANAMAGLNRVAA